MRHFHQLSEAEVSRLFSRTPRDFDRRADIDTLAMALGATLYMPATRPRLADDLTRQYAAGVMSSVVCLEDAVPDGHLAEAEANAVRQLRALHDRDPRGEAAGRACALPLTFVRVRHPEQIPAMVEGLGDAVALLSGFVLPKFTDETGPAYLEALAAARIATGLDLLAMPVLESPEVIYRESRREVLYGVARLLAKYRDLVLAVRLGATDLSSAYGLRRGRDLTVYDVPLVAEVITDTVNVLGRADGTGFVVTGPVWEYFADQDRLFKSQLRQTPFEDRAATRLRMQMVRRDLDGLIREIVLDKANGLTGKTVIHPTHVLAVHALSVVTHEEYADACDILGHDMIGGGVRRSSYRNKMNEAKPHRAWAERIIRRAEVFGVAADDVGFVELLVAAVAAGE